MVRLQLPFIDLFLLEHVTIDLECPECPDTNSSAEFTTKPDDSCSVTSFMLTADMLGSTDSGSEHEQIGDDQKEEAKHDENEGAGGATDGSPGGDEVACEGIKQDVRENLHDDNDHHQDFLSSQQGGALGGELLSQQGGAQGEVPSQQGDTQSEPDQMTVTIPIGSIEGKSCTCTMLCLLVANKEV